MCLLAQVEEAAGFLDKLADQSPVLAVLSAIILAQSAAICFIVRHFAGRIEGIATQFGNVMDTNSQRNYEQSEKRIESTRLLTEKLTTLIVTVQAGR